MTLDLVFSMVLLAIFVVGVNVTMGADALIGTDRLAALFANGAALAWPRGIQEEDDPRWMAARSEAVESLGWAGDWGGGAEIVEGPIPPVAVTPVRRIR